MGKPEIIGFEHDPNRSEWKDAPFEWITDAITGRELFSRGGYPMRELTYDNRVEVWRGFGFRPTYKPRPFRAWPAFGGYRVYCKRCKTTTHIGVDHLPHDTASAHRCLYNPEEINDAAS
jgi:hypothetical protein